jgi:multicomponent Na+:H+ antiporter subunit F
MIETGLNLAATVILLSLAVALVLVWRGPTRADRMMAAQLAGSSGVGLVILLAPSSGWPALDVALVLALLAALAAVAFVKSASADGLGDPEEEDVDIDALLEGRDAEADRHDG